MSPVPGKHLMKSQLHPIVPISYMAITNNLQWLTER